MVLSSVLIGNAISLVACSISAVSGYVKSKNKTLIMQTIQLSMSMIACIVLQSLSGAVLNALAVPRNILACKEKLNFPAKLIISILSAGLAVFFVVCQSIYDNHIVWVGLVPIIPTVLYTLYLDKADGIRFKLLVIQLMVFWTVHDMLIKSYVSSIFNVIQILLSLVAIIRIRIEKQKGMIAIENNGDEL